MIFKGTPNKVVQHVSNKQVCLCHDGRQSIQFDQRTRDACNTFSTLVSFIKDLNCTYVISILSQYTQLLICTETFFADCTDIGFKFASYLDGDLTKVVVALRRITLHVFKELMAWHLVALKNDGSGYVQ